MTQITQMKTRTLCDVICVNLRDLRANGVDNGHLSIHYLIEAQVEDLTQKGADAADDFLGRERLGDIACGTNLATAENIGGKAAGREHDDRQMLGFRVSAQPGRQIETICRCSKGHIQQHEVYFAFGKHSFSSFGGRCLKGRKAFPAKFKRQNPPNIRFIVDNQNAAPHMRKFMPVGVSDQDWASF
jgi:hypothetical protein